jgi:glyoxylase-like metal-dependent hydrolase (beta-lactamase superfamily II)
MTAFTTIDLHWAGRPKSVASLLIESGSEVALIDPGPESTLDALRSALRARGHDLDSLTSVLLTHIHLDHAGATGSLVRENPSLKVYVHEFGAAHMADPSRLLASAGRLYGGDLKTLYGECLPVPPANLIPLDGGEEALIGDATFAVLYTPGHASHHVIYWNPATRSAFVGDTAGIRVQGDSFLIPATPPPDIDLELWNTSLDAISALGPERIFLTHFGFIENPADHIRNYKTRLAEWTALTARLLASDIEPAEAERRFVDSIAKEVRSALPPAEAEHYIFNAGLRLSWLGLMRYVRKKSQQAGPVPAS